MMSYIDSSFDQFSSILDKLAREQNECLEEKRIPKWMIIEKTNLILKDTKKKPCLATTDQ